MHFTVLPMGRWGDILQFSLTVLVIIGHYIKRAVVERQGIRKREKNAGEPLINFEELPF